ncbi:MAG: tRNA adenosine(34) deaminase TadA [Pseudomonadales bacterium]|nr:tRNA adenosine(34) deaminase TadA [Pseudomonadales bacterium]
MDPEVWMDRALELAEKAGELDEVPVGAVIVLNGEVIGEGYNQPVTANDPTAHAEMVALRDAARRVGNYRLVDADLYVTVEPCTMCAGALVHARIARLYFGAREPRAGAVVSTASVLDNQGLNHRVDVTEGIHADACGRLMTDFFRRKR